MQSIHHDGSYGKLKPFSQEEMLQELKNPDVSHVEVFEATEEQIKYRQKLFNSKTRYQKSPKNRRR
ncbi:hypothetical protein CLU81_3581 [Flavobacterium sp. 9]|uniref:hypothetical protein n=1 Tax=Flavobacterium sp. 9 TaxID=2035198 RepID=UPI000C17DA73|nr:hypothetical protein [Flavobacterium sp. 9]PIF33011.1 hypothetical protein CLU81_3581 [Flavobacterium sp. 9]